MNKFDKITLEVTDRLTFPDAWKIQKNCLLDHDVKCSASIFNPSPLSGPHFLCDCGAVENKFAEIVNKKRGR